MEQESMSDEDRISLSRRKIIGSALSVGAAGAVGGLGTRALLWDEEKFGSPDTPNLLQGGELDLKVDWEVRYYDWVENTEQLIAQNELTDQPGPLINLTDVKPGDVMEATLSAHIFGNPAFLGWHYLEHVDSDNGITEPEDKVNGHTPDDSDGDPFVNTEPASGPGTLAHTPASITDLSDPNVTEEDLANLLVSEQGDVNIVSDSVSYTGASAAAGTFSGASDVLGLESGIILSSGNVNDIIGPNEESNTTTNFGNPGDSDLDGLIPGYDVFDATTLEFEFEVPEGAEKVYFSYVFGSEEYTEWVESAYNDVFGFFLNGENIASVPNPDGPGETAASINNINTEDNPSLFINNDIYDDQANVSEELDTEMDGFTVILDVDGEVVTDGTNKLKLGIADAGDRILDSWVLIEGGSLSTEPPSESTDGELDDVMRCVMWHDDGNNIPEEIWTGETDLGDPGPEEDLDEATEESYIMELGKAGNPSDVFDVEADETIFAGTLAETSNEITFNANNAIAGESSDTFQESWCYQNSVTEQIGVLCWVPRDIPGVNDNVIQTDRLEFEFGFNAIQCRHNVADDGGPINGTLSGADAGNTSVSPEASTDSTQQR